MGQYNQETDLYGTWPNRAKYIGKDRDHDAKVTNSLPKKVRELIEQRLTHSLQKEDIINSTNDVENKTQEIISNIPNPSRAI